MDGMSRIGEHTGHAGAKAPRLALIRRFAEATSIGAVIFGAACTTSESSAPAAQRGACTTKWDRQGALSDGPLYCAVMYGDVCSRHGDTFYPNQTCTELGYGFCCKTSLSSYRFRSKSDADWYDELSDPDKAYDDCGASQVTCPAEDVGAPSGGSTSGGSTSGGAGGCGSSPEGAYRCDKESETGIEVCRGGAWEAADSCGCAVKVGDPRKPPYVATCKVLIGTTPHAIDCGYASVSCKQCRPGEGCKTTCTKCASATSSRCCP